MQEKTAWGGLSSFALHLIAMALMLCDHLWATIVPGQMWMTMVGRLAFPIFAFMIVEGYHHTSNYKKYLTRMLLWAVITEIPFNLMVGASVFYPFHNNVLWTFAIGLWTMRILDNIRARRKPIVAVILSALVVFGMFWLGQLTMVDYHGYGVLMILVFYLFRGNKWYHYVGQLAGMMYINYFMIKGLVIPVELFGHAFELRQQALAVLALPIIWCYRGRQGYHSKATQIAFYAFYPVHLLILGLLSL